MTHERHWPGGGIHNREHHGLADRAWQRQRRRVVPPAAQRCPPV